MITVKDSTGTITGQALADLRATATPFPVVAIFESTTKPGLQADVRACVDAPAKLCIGVDPVHRFTWTEFGVDTGVRAADHQQAARAGNAEFRQGDWEGGVQAIASRAAVLSQRSASPAAVVIQQPRTVVEHPVSAWPFVVGFGLLMVAGWLLWRVLRREREKTRKAIDGLNEERFEFAQRNIEAMTSASPPPSLGAGRPPERVVTIPPAPTPIPVRRYVEQRVAPAYPAPAPQVVVVDRGSSGFIDGMMTEALLESARRPAYEPERHRRERTPEPVRESAPSWSSSSSSDDSSSGASGGSFDWGSSGGSGGDFGGGDSGGGGGGDF